MSEIKFEQVHLQPKFTIGQYVYPKCDPNQYPRLVTGIILRENNQIHILASNEDNEPEYEEFELSDKKILLP